MVSKTDFLAIIDYVAGLRDWIYAAHACMEASRTGQTFAETLNRFLGNK